MRTFDVASTVNAPAEEVWSLLTDTTRWPAWGPTVSTVTSDTRFVQPGSRGRVRTRIGLSLPFQIIGYVDGRAWSWRIAGVRATGHRVEPLGTDRSRVVFEVPVVAWPYAFVCRRALRRIARILSARTAVERIS